MVPRAAGAAEMCIELPMSRPGSRRLALVSLPVDVLLVICSELDFNELSRIAQTCRTLNTLVESFAWKAFLVRHPRPFVTIRCTSSPRERARYNQSVDGAWSGRSYIARAINEPWVRMRPVISLSPSRFAVGAGDQIVLFDVPFYGSTDHVQLHSPTCHRIHATDSRRDITGLVFLPDGGQDKLFCVARADGVVQRMQLSHSGSIVPTARYDHPYDPVLALAASDQMIATASRRGVISVFSARSPWQAPSTFTVKSKPWSIHINHSRTSVAVGTVGHSPLTIHSLSQSGPSHIPSTSLNGPEHPSAVYGLCNAAEGSIYGSSSSCVLVSGWYDGGTRLHDLRHKSKEPCLTLKDPWDDSPVFSVAAGGGSSCQVVSGSSHHGVVRIWDIRQPTHGWSAFAPGKDASPVYSLTMESSRLFGVTEARAFVMDFDPSVSPGDYPATPFSTRAAVRRGDRSLNGDWTAFYVHGLAKIDSSRRPARTHGRQTS